MTSHARPRPALHCTPPAGWLNDPHAIVAIDGRYRGYYQANPRSSEWAPNIEWAAIESLDLVTWHHVEPRVLPTGDETGCWSGCAVVDEHGPLLAYTSVASPDLGRGHVVSVRPGELTDRRLLIAGPPAATPATEFRDPHITSGRHVDGLDHRWFMAVGAGGDDGGRIVGFGSDDLEQWQHLGDLLTMADLANIPGSQELEGRVWECPQLCDFGEQWLLLVSVVVPEAPGHVAWVTGTRSGSRFTPVHAGRYAHGAATYATTTFVDAQHRHCAMSWLRESSPTADLPWAGALSLTHVVALRHGAPTAAFHPAVDAVFTVPVADDSGCYEVSNGRPFRVQVDARESWQLTAEDHDQQLWQITWRPGTLAIVDGEGTVVAQSPAEPGGVDIVIDADILEVITHGAGPTAVRVPVAQSLSLRTQGADRFVVTTIRARSHQVVGGTP